jgi:secondary thiamine-phosphate synthase enzyme
MIHNLTISTGAHTEFVDITSQVQAIVSDSKIADGMAIVYVPHTTAGITINEHADPSVVDDMIYALDRNIPWSDNYHHSEGNSAAHIKASLMGSTVNVLIEKSKLVLGTWQGIFFCDFDGPRTRQAIVKIFESA